MIRTALSLPRAWWANRRSANPKGFHGKPRFLTYLVTFSCNARCRMCDSWQKNSGNELTLEEVERIFAQLPRLDAVRLSGGEPFLRRDLGEIARLASTYLSPAMLHITSNGLLTRRIVDFCQHRDKGTTLHLLISLDAVGPKHDEIRGVEKAWERAKRPSATLPRGRRNSLCGWRSTRPLSTPAGSITIANCGNCSIHWEFQCKRCSPTSKAPPTAPIPSWWFHLTNQEILRPLAK